MGVYIHGYNFKSYKGGEYQYTNKLINELSNLPNIKGIKEENSNIWNSYNIFKDFEIKKCKDFEIILAGGSQRRHWFLGKEYFTFLSGIGSVFPEIDLNYYQYYQQGLFKNARHIIDNLEDMFFDTFFNIGWHIALRESLKIYDLIKGNKKPFPLDIKSDEKNNILKTLNSIDSIKNKVK